GRLGLQVVLRDDGQVGGNATRGRRVRLESEDRVIGRGAGALDEDDVHALDVDHGYTLAGVGTHRHVDGRESDGKVVVGTEAVVGGHYSVVPFSSAVRYADADCSFINSPLVGRYTAGHLVGDPQGSACQPNRNLGGGVGLAGFRKARIDSYCRRADFLAGGK